MHGSRRHLPEVLRYLLGTQRAGQISLSIRFSVGKKLLGRDLQGSVGIPMIFSVIWLSVSKLHAAVAYEPQMPIYS